MPERSASIACRQVAQNRMRLPDDNTIVVDDRDLAVRVHGAKFVRVETTEPSADFDVPVRQMQFADQPHDFLQIEGAPSSPDRKHGLPPHLRPRYRPERLNNSPKF